MINTSYHDINLFLIVDIFFSKHIEINL